MQLTQLVPAIEVLDLSCNATPRWQHCHQLQLRKLWGTSSLAWCRSLLLKAVDNKQQGKAHSWNWGLRAMSFPGLLPSLPQPRLCSPACHPFALQAAWHGPACSQPSSPDGVLRLLTWQSPAQPRNYTCLLLESNQCCHPLPPKFCSLPLAGGPWGTLHCGAQRAAQPARCHPCGVSSIFWHDTPAQSLSV